MRYRLMTCLLFAVAIFFIPLLALSGEPKIVQQIESNNSFVTPPAASAQPAPRAASEPIPPIAAPVANAALEGAESFKLLDRGTGKLLTVQTRDFVRGALAAELPPTFHPEALKAQAVAAHTYALQLKRLHEQSPDPALKGADLEADPKNWKSYTTEKLFRERYGSLADAYWANICKAADETLPYVVAYEGEPIVAAYCSMSSGRTEDAANVWTGGKPYLTPVESFGDTLAPDYETILTFTAEELRAALMTAWPKIKLGSDPSVWLRVSARSPSGYVTALEAGDLVVHGKELRSALELRSSDFEIAWDGANFTFTVKGYGHGVGFSQYGADYMARQGFTFDQILLHYYPGTTLAPLKRATS